MNVHNPGPDRDYLEISSHGLIGNLHTAALVSIDGSVESYCCPDFDSPSIFARILDKDKGGHFSITPTVPFMTKQNYLPSSNVLQTKFMNDAGVVSVTDYLPRFPKADTIGIRPTLLPWLIRRVEVIRGSIPLCMQCAPAFNYARSPHTAQIIHDDSTSPGLREQVKAYFQSEDGLTVDLRYVVESTLDAVEPSIVLSLLDLSSKGHLGPAVSADLRLTEGQCVTFILRNFPKEPRPGATQGTNIVSPLGAVRSIEDPFITAATNKYWNDWIRHSTYSGSWKEAVHRSALALKLLIYEPTGAVVASPTFSLPESIGGTRNCARFTWIRDSSFTLYALIRLGFTHEAMAFMEFIFDRLRDKNPDGSLQIMYTIHGSKMLEEVELTHLDGHKGSKPDIYGELMDCIYLGQKFGKPVLVRELSIWEVRNKKRHFTIMLWLVDALRCLRIADKRSLPCPNRDIWTRTRDRIYEDVMHKAWNPKLQMFGQSYENNGIPDSAVLIMPLVFFMHGSDPRFVSTLETILKTRDRGGLTSNNLVFRYDVTKTDDGVGGEEGTFCLCTLWCVEALTRAGELNPPLLAKAVSMFEDFLIYLNHVGLCSEEISTSGEA
ncbi:glycoside hydrolase family 15 protein [Fistulina hepatica ATCC 64428]|uniref:Glycoside hydrolase family 15 protein n=1 Tax=Fistulina hepatica ATCC 64428 TaxID=1128425 RepID=A0A0D7A3T2_9AGAR|nr:glycoside hydrolase family 15 protein [Fistulina hepatica ATCC 64428]